MKFPNWTPDWVQNEFLRDFPEVNPDELDAENSAQSRLWLMQLIESPESQVVWSTLNKHPDHEDRLSELSAIIWNALWGFGHVEIRKSEKIKIAKEARKHASALTRALARITEQDQFQLAVILARFINRTVSDRLSADLEEFAESNRDDSSPDYVSPSTLERATPAIRQIEMQLLAEVLLLNLPYHLEEGLCSSLEQWASVNPVVSKPEHDNARRLYFIRKVTDGLVDTFGRPMRKETLAMATVFFDTSGLDEAAISRLAPVRNQKKLSV